MFGGIFLALNWSILLYAFWCTKRYTKPNVRLCYSRQNLIAICSLLFLVSAPEALTVLSNEGHRRNA